MSISETFSRSWEITQKSFHVIMADKEILAFPILASIFSILLFALMAVPFLMAEVMRAIGIDKLGSLLLYIFIFVFYLGLAFISSFFNVAVVYCAKKRFEGHNPTFGEGLGEAFKRIHLIFMWSLLSATVGVLLRMLESSAKNSKNGIGRIIGSIIVSILGVAWGIASVFVIPAIVFNNVGPFEALKISVHSVKKTWGESLIRHYGLGFAQTAFIIGGVLVLLIPSILLLFASFIAAVVLFAVFVIYVIIVSLVFSTADTIYNTAIFMYASTGKVPHVYSAESIKNAFVRK